MLYLLHGENRLQRQEALTSVIEKSGLMPDLREMNVEVLESAASFSELKQAYSVLPFLSEARIVIARDLLSKAPRGLLQDILNALADVPSTTHLIFDENKTLGAKHPIVARAKEMHIQVRHFALPGRDLPRWIRQRTKRYGGQMAPRAAALLAQNIGEQLELLDQEIRKLLLYTGARRSIEVDDVQVMVPYVQSADVIFQMVDAVGQRNARRAATYLHRLLDVGEHPLGIFGMIVRQFRMLIQVRWLIDQHHPQSQITTRLKLHPYVARKVHAQADKFTPTQLRQAYHLLLDVDLAIKRGKLPPETALDLLVAQLTHL